MLIFAYEEGKNIKQNLVVKTRQRGLVGKTARPFLLPSAL